jgi:hypothetical protein
VARPLFWFFPSRAARGERGGTMKESKIKEYLRQKEIARDLYNNTSLSAAQVAVQLRLSYAKVLKMLDNKDPKSVIEYLKNEK